MVIVDYLKKPVSSSCVEDLGNPYLSQNQYMPNFFDNLLDCTIISIEFIFDIKIFMIILANGEI